MEGIKMPLAFQIYVGVMGQNCQAFLTENVKDTPIEIQKNTNTD